METLLLALGWVLILEAILPFIAPDQWRRVVTELAQQPDTKIRKGALIFLLTGLTIVWWLV